MSRRQEKEQERDKKSRQEGRGQASGVDGNHQAELRMANRMVVGMQDEDGRWV